MQTNHYNLGWVVARNRPKIMARDLGELGEATLRLWTSEVGAVVNPAVKDRRGWDFLIEFPHDDKISQSSLDLRPPEISCLIQVKTTVDDRRRWSVRLANWERLAKHPLPAFYLIVIYEKHSNSVKRAYLVHVGDKWIDRVLERLRIHSTKGGKKLSCQTLDLTWADDESLSSPNGLQLEKSIRKYTGKGLDIYVENKLRRLKEAGDITPAIMTFTRTASNHDELIDEWVDLAIGLKDSIEVQKTIIKENIRFGIPTVVAEYKGGMLYITDRAKEGTDVDLTIRNNTVERASKLLAKLHTPHHFFPGQPIPDKHLKARVVFQVGQIIIHPFTNRINIHVDFSTAKETAELKEHAATWRIAQILHNTPTEGCSIEVQRAGKPKAVFSIAPSQSATINPSVLVIAQAVENAFFIGRVFDLPQDLRISIRQIDKQADLLLQLRAICDVNIPIAGIEVTLDESFEEKQERYAIAFSKAIKFGELTLLVSAGLTGPIRITKHPSGISRCALLEPKRIHLTHKVFTDEVVQSQTHLQEVVKELEKKNYTVIQVGDPIDKPFQ